MKKLLTLFFALTLFFSCQQPTKKVLIDNPSEEKITIVIDEIRTYNLEAHQSREIEIKFGKRSLKVNNNEPVEIYLDRKKDYMINPLNETYYIEDVMFFISDQAREEYMRYNPPTSKIEGVEVNGQFKKIEGNFLIEKSWKFGPDDPPMGKIGVNTPRNISSYALKKIHRKVDLLNRMNESVTKFLEEALQKNNQN